MVSTHGYYIIPHTFCRNARGFLLAHHPVPNTGHKKKQKKDQTVKTTTTFASQPALPSENTTHHIYRRRILSRNSHKVRVRSLRTRGFTPFTPITRTLFPELVDMQPTTIEG